MSLGRYVWFFFFKQKTAYEMRISDWSSDVCSSDLDAILPMGLPRCASFALLNTVVSIGFPTNLVNLCLVTPRIPLGTTTASEQFEARTWATSLDDII